MTTQSNYSTWLKKIVKVALLQHPYLKKEAQPGNRRQDLSRPILENLLQQGYDTVTWDSGTSVCPICRELHNQKWSLADFLTGLLHDAPIAEKSHPNDKSCFVIIQGPGLQSIRVDYDGNMEYL